MASAPRKTQLTAWLDNKPGHLAKLGKVLRQAKVNILALSVEDSADYSGVRMVVDDAARAKKALDKAKIPFSARPVLLLTMTNEIGTLGRIAERLGKGGVNVDYTYGSTHPRQPDAQVVLACDDIDTAATIIRKLAAL